MMPLIGVLLLMSLVISGSEAQRGGSCVAPNGQQGSCISISDCPALRSILAQITAGAAGIAELRRSICHLAGTSILVCCVAQTTPVINPTQIFQRDRPTSQRDPIFQPDPTFQPGHTHRGSLLPTKCGTQGLVGRIIAGHAAPLGAWPWIVNLRGKHSNGRNTWFCGGTLISDRYVLTAAHCLTTESGIQLEIARIGEHDFGNTIDCSKFGKCAPQPQDIPVERIIKHPSYGRPCGQCNDIALLRLSTPVNLNSKYVTPICLPINPQRDMGFSEHEFSGLAAWAAGWGTISKDRRKPIRPGVLQQVQLPIVNQHRNCEFEKKSYGDPTMVMCAGGEGRDTCQGDSGGPLTLTNNVGTKHFIIGVTSKGPLVCGAPNTVGIFTSVHHYIPWIMSNLQP